MDLPVISRALNLTELLAQMSAFSYSCGGSLSVSFRHFAAVSRFPRYRQPTRLPIFVVFDGVFNVDDDER